MKFIYLLTIVTFIGNHSFGQTINGCTDKVATNYNAQATDNDGSCMYANTTISLNFIDTLPPTIAETSGMIILNGNYYTHVDNDNTNLYAIDTLNASITDSISLWPASNKDWEAIAKHDSFIYIGDFGNNATGIREDLKIYKIKIDQLSNDTLAIDSIQFQYQDQTQFTNPSSNQTAYDAEAFIVSQDTILIFSKNWLTEKTVVYALPNLVGQQTAVAIDSFDVKGLITDAYYDEQKKLIVLLGYTKTLSPFFYLVYDFKFFNFATANKRSIKVNGLMMQTEAIASSNNLNYWITAEQVSYLGQTNPASIYNVNLAAYLDHYINPKPQSINNINSSTLTIYPNPSTNYIIIPISNIDKRDVVVIDINGKHLDCPISITDDNFLQVNVAQLKAGNYIIKVKNSTTKFTKL